MIERVGSQASERRTERSGSRNPLGLRSGRSRKSRSLRRAGRVIPPNPTRPARSHYWSAKVLHMSLLIRILLVDYVKSCSERKICRRLNDTSTQLEVDIRMQGSLVMLW